MKHRMLRLQWCAVLGFLFVGGIALAMDVDQQAFDERRRDDRLHALYRADNWHSAARSALVIWKGTLQNMGEPELTQEFTRQIESLLLLCEKEWARTREQVLANANMACSTQGGAADFDVITQQFAKKLRLDESPSTVQAWATAKGIRPAESSS